MSRDWQLYRDDMREACRRIMLYTQGLDAGSFHLSDMIRDAVLRNLEIIGEAAKRLPQDIRNEYPAIDWRGIAGFRDIIAHAYFGIDPEILWDVTFHKIPELRRQLGE